MGHDNGVVSRHQRRDRIPWMISDDEPGRHPALTVWGAESLVLPCLLLASIW